MMFSNVFGKISVSLGVFQISENSDLVVAKNKKSLSQLLTHKCKEGSTLKMFHTAKL